MKNHLKNYNLKSNIKLFDYSIDQKHQTVTNPFLENSNLVSQNHSLYHSNTHDISVIDEKFKIGRNSIINETDDKYSALANQIREFS